MSDPSFHPQHMYAACPAHVRQSIWTCCLQDADAGQRGDADPLQCYVDPNRRAVHDAHLRAYGNASATLHIWSAASRPEVQSAPLHGRSPPHSLSSDAVKLYCGTLALSNDSYQLQSSADPPTLSSDAVTLQQQATPIIIRLPGCWERVFNGPQWAQPSGSCFLSRAAVAPPPASSPEAMPPSDLMPPWTDFFRLDEAACCSAAAPEADSTSLPMGRLTYEVVREAALEVA